MIFWLCREFEFRVGLGTRRGSRQKLEPGKRSGVSKTGVGAGPSYTKARAARAGSRLVASCSGLLGFWGSSGSLHFPVVIMAITKHSAPGRDMAIRKAARVISAIERGFFRGEVVEARVEVRVGRQ